MNSAQITNLFNFGLVVLIWAVQLIIYPSFQYYALDDLIQWHDRYTKAISIIVIPLMLGQLLLTSYRTLIKFNPTRLAISILVLIIWGVTFLAAVPLHGQIAVGQETEESIASLIRVNWFRTALWNIIFILGLLIEDK